MKFARILAASLTLVLPARTAPQSVAGPDSSARIERLVGLARTWGYVKYFHPALPGRPDIDWDAALIATIPTVRSARSSGEYSAAVQRMLAVLGDPLTRVVPTAPATPADAKGADPQFGYRLTDGDVLVVTAGDYYALNEPSVQRKLQELAIVLPKARAVVFDLRSTRAVDGFGRLQLAGSFSEIQRLLTTRSLSTPGERRRVYYGFESPTPFSSGQYRTGYFVQNGAPVLPAKNARDIPTVFLANEHSALLSATLPLQAAHSAVIVYEGDIGRHTIGAVETVPLGEGLEAQVRQSEPIFPDGTPGAFRPDVIVRAHSPGAGDSALGRALAMARSFAPPRTTRSPLPASVAPLRERSYATMGFPSVEYRLLAAFRIWNAIQYFYPYKQLLDRDWSLVLGDLIPVFESASNAKDYALAVAAAAYTIQDSHAYISGGAFSAEVVPPGYPPIRVRLIAGLPVVTSLVDTVAARRAGVEIGDIVEKVDGDSASARLARLVRIVPASTEWSRAEKVALSFMNGPVGSKVTLTLRGVDDRVKDVVLDRRYEDFNTLYHRERSGDVVRILPGNVGYVDLDRLTFDMVEPMFERLKDTRAIVFDMRGYPNGTIWAIAPRLTDTARVVALFGTPMIGHGSPAPSIETFRQRVEPAPAGVLRYRKPTAMLMDERTVSQAEHTGLYLKAVNGTVFVGGRTAGADGEITTVSVPGGLTIGFTGQAVTWPDGRQLQRIGLTPDVPASPTLAGIRAGRDEVLEAALSLPAFAFKTPPGRAP
ncbi:MAG TPA: S41 family peptidase [Gemmatimonadaceae bacterium]|nr:S41 family peptidase [Gemmatimonadaceae bacterium]